MYLSGKPAPSTRRASRRWRERLRQWGWSWMLGLAGGWGALSPWTTAQAQFPEDAPPSIPAYAPPLEPMPAPPLGPGYPPPYEEYSADPNLATEFANNERLFTIDEVRSIVREELANQHLYQPAPATNAPKEHVVGADLSMKANWNNGFEVTTPAKDFRVHVGGRAQMDTSWFSVPQTVQNNINVPYGDGIDFRRARMRIDGTMYEVIEWAMEYDFVNSARVRNQPASATNPGFFDETLTAPTDLWIQAKALPVLGNVRVGNQKEPIGFEHLVSSRWLPFMERSFNQDTFYGGLYNGFTPGIAAFNNYDEDDMGYWHVGAYKPMNSVFAFSTGDGDYALTGRLTHLLYYVDEGRGLMHFGVSARQATGVSQAGALDGQRLTTFRTRDHVRSGLSADWPVPASISLFGEELQFLNTEFAMVHGPLTVQGEWLFSRYQDARTTSLGPPVGTVDYDGGYIQAFYYLTGENDQYNKKTAVFERVKPNENFFLVRDTYGCSAMGLGAWQIGARYNYLDLNDQGLNGGMLHAVTGGLNWFLNPNLKVQFNYNATYRDAPLAPGVGDGWINGWGTRVAFDF